MTTHITLNALKEAVIAVSSPVPAHNWSDHKLGFGKHADLTYAEMADDQRGYLLWIVQTFQHSDQRWIAANAVLSGLPIPGLVPEPDKPEPDDTIRLVSFTSGMIGIHAPFSEKDRCKALSERRWEKPYWVCPGAIIEEVVAAFPEAELSSGFMKILAKTKEIADLSPHTPSAYNLPNFGNGKEMMPFQKAGLEFVEATDANTLIADSMGLGKTVQALSYLALHPEMRPVVVVCPASLKLNWRREADAWLETEERIEVIQGGKPYKLDADIVIINYDVLKKWLSELQYIEPQILIADESHAVKNPKSARSKAMKDLAADIPHKIFLTGTPVLGRPAELWNQLSIIDPITYCKNRFFQWHKRYAAAHKIYIGYNKTAWDFSGASNLDELAQSLKKTIMIRRTKEQVLPELPAKRRSTLLIPIDNRKEYDRVDNEFLEWMTEQKGLEAAEKASYGAQIAKREYLKQVAIRGKMKLSVDWIRNFLATGEKLVVFATHRTAIETMAEAFSGCAVSVMGGMTAHAKDDAVIAFQTDPDIKLFIGNIQAAGVGLTLTAASNVVFLELPDGPEMLKQCEDRCHRIGQENAVNVYYLLAENTIDQSITTMLEEKREVIDQITEDDDGLGFNLFDLVTED